MAATANRVRFEKILSSTKEFLLGSDLWTADEPYAVGDQIAPTVFNGFEYVAIIAGTGASDSEEPEWPEELGETVEDGDIVWECVAPVEYPALMLQLQATTSQTAGDDVYIDGIKLKQDDTYGWVTSGFNFNLNDFVIEGEPGDGVVGWFA